MRALHGRGCLVATVAKERYLGLCPQGGEAVDEKSSIVRPLPFPQQAFHAMQGEQCHIFMTTPSLFLIYERHLSSHS